MNPSKNLYLEKYLNQFSHLLKKSFDMKKINQCQKIIKKIKNNNKKIIFIGNGGSAAIASHAVVDYLKVGKIKCINFNEPGLFTCFANDFGHDKWMAKAIEHQGNDGDLLISISSSGMSKNIINACIEAKKRKFESIITFTGFTKNNKVNKLGNINFWVNSKVYNFIENIHQILILSILDDLVKTKIDK